MTTTFRRIAPNLALLLILFIGFALRTYNVDWADGQLPHPDERSTIAFYAPTIKWPSEPGTFFDPRRSTLNPLWDVQANHRRSYTYGHFPLYVLVAAGHLTVKLAPVAEALGVSDRIVDMMRIADGSPGYAWVGRVLMALADTLTLLYLYLLGKRMWNKKVGLLAAALGAFTVTQIQLAHFFAVDPISTAFTVAAVYHAIRMVDTGGWKQTVLTGVMAALAIASKFSAAPILAAPAVAGLIISWQQQRGERKGTPGILLGATAIVIAFVVFALTSPFVFLDFESFNQAVIKEQGAMVRGEADFPFTRQYRGTTPYLYFIRQQVQWGMGWFLGLVGWIAFGWAVVRLFLRRSRPSELIVLSWLIPYFGITGAFLAKFNRYMMPVVPFLSLLGAGMLWSLAWWWVRRRQAPTVDLPAAAPLPPASAPVAADMPPARPPAHMRVIDLSSASSSRESVPVAVEHALAPEPAPTQSPTSSTPKPPPPSPVTDGNRLFAFLAMIVLLPTVLWALAFVNGVYRTEHPFITASKWMYENIPDGSVWITEHWEEGM
ncbi:MAG: phospholipid carrier-dependent glycosyltransferase, partial [Chloroflexi bacterium]|nr:phospholipid carrier-dependent glycosyltransferase [Chloroflexota bacterium]